MKIKALVCKNIYIYIFNICKCCTICHLFVYGYNSYLIKMYNFKVYSTYIMGYNQNDYNLQHKTTEKNHNEFSKWINAVDYDKTGSSVKYEKLKIPRQ